MSSSDVDTRRALPVIALLALLLQTALLTAAQSGRRTFAVVTWNIRSGMGAHGFAASAWRDDTLNCDDESKPRNAWGAGLPQRVLEALRDDPTVVAVALQEAWNCGSPERINRVLGFKAMSREQEGVALAARYGFAAPVDFQRIDVKNYRWIAGAPVCLDAACSASIPMYATHWGGMTNADGPAQARAALARLSTESRPHLFMGDLNMYVHDRFSPPAPCSGKEIPEFREGLGLITAAGYVDAWTKTQDGEGYTGMSSRRGCGSTPGGLYKRIDYVFAKGLEPLRAVRVGQVEPGADAPSDHAGLRVEFARP